jgi:hypothetical protein
MKLAENRSGWSHAHGRRHLDRSRDTSVVGPSPMGLCQQYSSPVAVKCSTLPKGVVRPRNTRAFGRSEVNGTRKTSEAETAGEGWLDPREAATLFEQTRLQARRRVEPAPPWLLVARSEILGTPPSRSPGTCTAPSRTRVRSAVQRLSAAMGWENVCRGNTFGYTAAKRPPRILSETASDVMKERGLLPLPAAPPSGMLGSIQMPYERARRPLNGSVCGETVCGNRSAPTPDGDRPDHRSW